MNERAVSDALARALADFESANGSRKLVGKGIVDAILYKDTVGADASLAR
jgi:hypothetical protein